MRDLRTLTLTLGLLVVALLVPSVALASGSGAVDAGAAAVAQPAPTAAPELTIAATPATVTAGDQVRLVVGLGIADAPVRLSRMRAGATGFSPAGDFRTGAGGTVTVAVKPVSTTTYRVEFAGDAQWLPASAEVTVSVRPRVTLSVAPRVYRGRTTWLSVSVRPLHAGASVTVQRWGDGAWAEWKTLALGRESSLRTLWRGNTAGLERLRVLMPADTEHAEGTSLVRRVQVVKPNPYNVPLDAKGIIVVDISQYTLRFYSHGQLLRTFPCVTGRPSLPTPIGHFKVYARGMWPGGPYGARIMSYHPPCAIHGTNEPWLLSRFPRNFSHGCTRLSNPHAIWLYDHAPLGTPVWNVP
jgi:hypothetical protein